MGGVVGMGSNMRQRTFAVTVSALLVLVTVPIAAFFGVAQYI